MNLFEADSLKIDASAPRPPN